MVAIVGRYTRDRHLEVIYLLSPDCSDLNIQTTCQASPALSKGASPELGQ